METAPDLLTHLWWLFAFVAIVGALRGSRRRKRSRRRRRRRFRAVETLPTGTIKGKAYVTDGDGLRVAGHEVRFAALDAPEWDQRAKHQDGYWFKHGSRVKSALIRRIGGKHVLVTIEDTDKFGRLVATVTCNRKDIGEWLVREGHAIAAYSDRYNHVEREARKAKRGMWGLAHHFDPRAHRAWIQKKDLET